MRHCGQRWSAGSPASGREWVALPKPPGTGEENKVMCAGEVSDILRGWVNGKLDHVGALDELCSRKMVVSGVFGKGARIENEDPEEATKPIESPHSHTSPDPGVVLPCC